MNRKSQAAIEYLSTYGWALLIALAVIGSVVYFGILSPERFVKEKCELGDQIRCVDWLITQRGDVLLKLYNGYETSIEITDLEIEDFPELNCEQAVLMPGQAENYVCLKANPSAPVNRQGKQNFKLSLSYRRYASGAPVHTLPGKITARVHYTGFLPTCRQTAGREWLGGVDQCSHFINATWTVCPDGKSITHYGSGTCCAVSCLNHCDGAQNEYFCCSGTCNDEVIDAGFVCSTGGTCCRGTPEYNCTI